MSNNDRWRAICEDAGDGSGDLIVELPSEVLAKMGVGPGDELNLEVVHGRIILSPKKSLPLLP